MGGDDKVMKVILLDELSQEWLNQLIEEGEIFVATSEGSLLSECSIVTHPEQTGCVTTAGRDESLREK